MQVAISGSSSFIIQDPGTNRLDDNVSDLQPRNHLYLTAGVTNLSLTFPLDTTTLSDGYEWISQYRGEGFDLIFADAMPGKYDLFEETIAMLRPAGFYIIDDMLPQPNWPSGHDLKVQQFIRMLEERTDLALTKLNWSTGIMIVVKK